MAKTFNEELYEIGKEQTSLQEAAMKQEGLPGAIAGSQYAQIAPELAAIYERAAGGQQQQFEEIQFPGLFAEHPLIAVVNSLGLDRRLHVGWQGKAVRIKDLDRILKKSTKKWTKEKVASLQKRLGIDDYPGVVPGQYGKLTQQIHKLYIIARHRKKGIGTAASVSILRDFRKEMAEKKAQLEEQKRRQEMARTVELAQLRSASGAFWQRFTGETPTEGNVTWLTQRFEEGWDDWKMYSYIRSTPGFKKKYPGITENMLPSEYEGLQQQANELYIKYRGRLPTPDEFVSLMNGGWRNEK